MTQEVARNTLAVLAALAALALFVYWLLQDGDRFENAVETVISFAKAVALLTPVAVVAWLVVVAL